MPKINPNTLRVRNWDRWQSYRKDRGQPPWIKLHQSLRRDPDFIVLTDAQKGQLMCLWLLAADKNGVIPYDPIKIQKLLYLDHNFDLEFFVLQGFLIKGNSRRQRDANVTTTWQPHDALETETEAETDGVHLNGHKIDFSAFWNIYPKKKDRGTAERAWNRLSEQQRQAAVAVLPAYQFNDDPKFVKYPGTWLNAHSWEDETAEPDDEFGGVL